MATAEQSAEPRGPAVTHRGGIVIVEDEALFARAVSKRLTREGYDVRVANTLSEARVLLDAQLPELILLDIRLPDGSGLEFLQALKKGDAAAVTVIVMTAFGELDDAVTAMKLGAADYLKKPVDLDELTLNVGKVFHQHELSQALDYSKAREGSGRNRVEVIGSSAVMRKVKDQLGRIARLGDLSNDNPPTILITGETGTGKDLAARAIHGASARGDRPFVHVDCASLPAELIEAELFGHVKGAFTSAHGERLGLIEAAEDGTLFLDEIGELPIELQAKLLAVLERRQLRRVGSSKEIGTKAWFIAATNRDLEDMIREGTFRSDLYFRLNVLTLELPPLRERGEDLITLARHFADANGRRYGMRDVTFTDDAVDLIARYEWPGNVRELGHVIERAVLLGGGEISCEVLNLEPSGSRAAGGAAAANMRGSALADRHGANPGESSPAGFAGGDQPFSTSPDAASANAPHAPGASDAMASGGTATEGSGDDLLALLDEMTLEEVERFVIERALERTGDNVSEAARQLGITRMTMRYRMKKYGFGG